MIPIYKNWNFRLFVLLLRYGVLVTLINLINFLMKKSILLKTSVEINTHTVLLLQLPSRISTWHVVMKLNKTNCVSHFVKIIRAQNRVFHEINEILLRFSRFWPRRYSVRVSPKKIISFSSGYKWLSDHTTWKDLIKRCWNFDDWSKLNNDHSLSITSN